MKPVCACLLLLISGWSGCDRKEQLTPSEKMADPREVCVANIERKIQEIVHTTKDWELAESRIYLQTYFDGDDIPDAILLTGFDHGNFDRQEIFVCLSSSPRNVMHLEIGHRGERIAQQMKIENRKIVVTGKLYGPKDATCCPSHLFTATFAVADGKLAEVK